MKIDIKPLSEEELLERQFNAKKRDLRISRMRALVIRNKISEAYSILENIRFDYLGDTAFREKIVRAKMELEKANDDFLLDDQYWKEKIDKYTGISVEDYKKEIQLQSSLPTQSN